MFTFLAFLPFVVFHFFLFFFFFFLLSLSFTYSFGFSYAAQAQFVLEWIIHEGGDIAERANNNRYHMLPLFSFLAICITSILIISGDFDSLLKVPGEN